MKRHAMAVWQGDLKQGKGQLSTESGVLKDTPYSFNTRFEQGSGTNPEELIGAAHAGCFTMALSGVLAKAGFMPDRLQTDAAVTLEQVQGDWTISAIHLKLDAKVPGVSNDKLHEYASQAKENCPVSRALNVSVTLEEMQEA